MVHVGYCLQSYTFRPQFHKIHAFSRLGSIAASLLVLILHTARICSVNATLPAF